MALIHFSTGDYSKTDRLEASRDAYSAMAQVELVPHDVARFHLDARIRLLPGVSIAQVGCSPMRVRRGPSQVADGNDDLVLLIKTEPGDRWFLKLENRGEHSCGPSEACLIARDSVGCIESHSGTRGLLNISLSRDVLLATGAPRSFEPGRRLPPSRTLTLLQHYARSLLDAPKDGDLDLVQAAAHLQDLAVLLLGGHRDALHRARGRGLRVARLRAIKADLAAHAWRGDLSLEWVAARHDISPRYVRALFEHEGTTFTDCLLDLRLKRVFDELSNPGRTDRSISAIAYGAGFNNSSWFYRAFKQRFGMTPGDARQGSRAHR